MRQVSAGELSWFATLVVPLTSAERRLRMLEEIWHIDRASTIAALMDALVVDSRESS
ncbi:hypothetical protein [Kibdelosporangium aridum]|uniref:hypothetical protein n=1 Tax=Kibdelosporangium aridum TaxID=2030 RepID=UPI000B1404AA|nr:hypothetical protein [Kibdelosporangium aridum]